MFVQRTKDVIKNGPQYDLDRMTDTQYREQFGSCYGPGGTGYDEGVCDYSRSIGARRGDDRL